jgi:hypothetical protein
VFEKCNWNGQVKDDGIGRIYSRNGREEKRGEERIRGEERRREEKRREVIDA